MPRATRWQRKDGAQEIAVDDGADVLFLYIDGVVGVRFAAGCGDVATGVVDEDVDGAELVFYFGDDAVDLVGLGEVGEESNCGHAGLLADFSGGGCQGGAFTVLCWSFLAHAVNAD